MSTVSGFASLIGALSTFVLWFRLIHQVKIPKNRSPFVITALASAALGVATLVGDPGWIGGVPASLGVFLGSLFGVLVLISPQRADGAIQVGETIPDVIALDDSGATISLASFSGRPMLLKFFRGHW